MKGVHPWEVSVSGGLTVLLVSVFLFSSYIIIYKVSHHCKCVYEKFKKNDAQGKKKGASKYYKI